MTKIEEVWNDIPGLRGYQISNHARARSVDRTVIRNGFPFVIKGKVLKACPQLNRPYFAYSISINGKAKRFVRHRAVAVAFVPNPEGKPYVNHKIPAGHAGSSDLPENLEWVTAQENSTHAKKFGLYRPPNKGISHHKARECKYCGKLYKSYRKVQQTCSKSCANMLRESWRSIDEYRKVLRITEKSK